MLKNDNLKITNEYKNDNGAHPSVIIRLRYARHAKLPLSTQPSRTTVECTFYLATRASETTTPRGKVSVPTTPTFLFCLPPSSPCTRLATTFPFLYLPFFFYSRDFSDIPRTLFGSYQALVIPRHVFLDRWLYTSPHFARIPDWQRYRFAER